MGTVSKTLNIVANTTYNLAIDLWAWSIWATEAGITTTYSSLANLLADEKAVRQLMTVHKSVDYLANYPSGADRETLNTIINNDICAKWINLSDYALDTLSANADIKSVMDTADKYGYGEWGKINSTTWGALGNVPVMTSNSAPYGVASAYQVFDGNASTSASGTDFSYQSVNPICVKRYKALGANGTTITGTIQGSNNGSTWTNITLASNTTYYMYHRLHFASSTAVYTLQFYGRELTPLIPTMTSNTTPRGEASQHMNTADSAFVAYKAFDGTSQTWAGSGYATSGHNGEYIQYNAPAIRAGFKPKKIYINEGRSESNRVLSCQYTAIMSDDNFATSETVATLETSVASGVAVLADINTNLTKDIRLVCNSSTGNLNYSHSTYGMVYYYIMDTIQIFGMDYSEKEFAQGSTRKTIYDHGVEPSGAITGGTKNPDCLTLSAVGTATVTIDKGTRTYMGGKAGLHASGTNRLKCGSGYSAFTASNMPDSNGFDISSISGSVAVGIEQTASGTFDCTEIWIE